MGWLSCLAAVSIAAALCFPRSLLLPFLLPIFTNSHFRNNVPLYYRSFLPPTIRHTHVHSTIVPTFGLSLYSPFSIIRSAMPAFGVPHLLPQGLQISLNLCMDL